MSFRSLARTAPARLAHHPLRPRCRGMAYRRDDRPAAVGRLDGCPRARGGAIARICGVAMRRLP